jgi:hypothetical protein
LILGFSAVFSKVGYSRGTGFFSMATLGSSASRLPAD